jgi:DNA-directed RNA polymerase subunit beta'
MLFLTNLRHKAHNETSKQRRTEALKRFNVVEAFREVLIPE